LEEKEVWGVMSDSVFIDGLGWEGGGRGKCAVL